MSLGESSQSDGNSQHRTSVERGVFLLEDDDDHAALFERAARRAKLDGVSLTRYANATSALQQLAELNDLPQLLVLDLKMPGMDGPAALHALRQSDKTRHLPVVVLTTSAARLDRQRAYSSGANGYLVKPLDASAYREMVADLLTYWLRWNVVQ